MEKGQRNKGLGTSAMRKYCGIEIALTDPQDEPVCTQTIIEVGEFEESGGSALGAVIVL